MSLLSNALSAFEIAFRWAGLDHRRTYFFLPLPVRDNCRNIMDAILRGHLLCNTISLERKDYSPEEELFSAAYWLDDIYACIHGHKFNRKLLRRAEIDRSDFMVWCQAQGIPLPEFWFPAGWNLEFQWPDEEEMPGFFFRRQYHSGNSGDLLADIAHEHSQTEGLTETPAPSKLRPNQRIRIACQQIASAIWREEPTRTLDSVVSDELIQKYGGGQSFINDTIEEWLREVIPASAKRPRGRPRKNTL